MACELYSIVNIRQCLHIKSTVNKLNIKYIYNPLVFRGSLVWTGELTKRYRCVLYMRVTYAQLKLCYFIYNSRHIERIPNTLIHPLRVDHALNLRYIKFK